MERQKLSEKEEGLLLQFLNGEIPMGRENPQTITIGNFRLLNISDTTDLLYELYGHKPHYLRQEVQTAEFLMANPAYVFILITTEEGLFDKYFTIAGKEIFKVRENVFKRLETLLKNQDKKVKGK